MRRINPNFIGIYANKGSKNNIFTYMTGSDSLEDIAHIDYFLPMYDTLQVGDRIQLFLLNGVGDVEKYLEYLIVSKDEPNRKIYKHKLNHTAIKKTKEDNKVTDGQV